MTDLTKEFREGMDAPHGAPCPYYATSNCADAWWLGHRWHDRESNLMRGDHRLDGAKVTRGRGVFLNVLQGSGKVCARVVWLDRAAPLVEWA